MGYKTATYPNTEVTETRYFISNVRLKEYGAEDYTHTGEQVRWQ